MQLFNEILSEIQPKIGEWNKRNFPVSPPYHSLLGIGEELGELQQSWFMKEMKGINDSFADTVIYTVAFCERQEIDASYVYGLASVRQNKNGAVFNYLDSDCDVLKRIIVQHGLICHAYLKTEQKIRANQDHLESMQRAVGDLLLLLKKYSGILHVNLNDVVLETLKTVLVRDWQKYPETGVAVV